MTKIKICGLTRETDVETANYFSLDFVGFVVDYSSSRRNVTVAEAIRLTRRLAPAIRSVGVFVNRPVEQVASTLNDGVFSVAQLSGNEDENYLRRLRELAPNATIFQSIVVRSKQDVVRAQTSTAERLLFDSGRGGGTIFDWEILSGERNDRTAAPQNFLAGGLSPEIVASALQQLNPWGVDVSSGVETNGRKDVEKIRRFVDAVRTFDAQKCKNVSFDDGVRVSAAQDDRRSIEIQRTVDSLKHCVDEDYATTRQEENR